METRSSVRPEGVQRFWVGRGPRHPALGATRSRFQPYCSPHSTSGWRLSPGPRDPKSLPGHVFIQVNWVHLWLFIPCITSSYTLWSKVFEIQTSQSPLQKLVRIEAWICLMLHTSFSFLSRFTPTYPTTFGVTEPMGSWQGTVWTKVRENTQVAYRV